MMPTTTSKSGQSLSGSDAALVPPQSNMSGRAATRKVLSPGIQDQLLEGSSMQCDNKTELLLIRLDNMFG